MFGNILSDAEIIRLRDSHLLTLEPFDVKRLKIAHYKLAPRTVWTPVTTIDGKPSKRQEHNFEDEAQFVFQPNAYHLFEVEETVLLPDGVVANFVPVSEFALRGFSLVAGMLDAGYGKLAGRTQKLFFGVKNLLDEKNMFDRNFGLAHMSIVSLTGASLLRQELSKAELGRLAGRDPERWRRANDDGVFYPQ
ncbi:hypothetical protein I6E74_10075 [Salinibacterium sp. SWN139]|uniref:dCTP deaminase domain-containing protein n=1 Tax=Salinibacterium sp. SWN139 TaxID=2792055 RepID=UPI0018CEE64B|nr:hypothetical protein [Salinibacterium sp. SWN139]MBH0054511.1 hypothetical protein [Salinibacterium sp. SWN139]